MADVRRLVAAAGRAFLAALIAFACSSSVHAARGHGAWWRVLQPDPPRVWSCHVAAIPRRQLPLGMRTERRLVQQAS